MGRSSCSARTRLFRASPGAVDGKSDYEVHNPPRFLGMTNRKITGCLLIIQPENFYQFRDGPYLQLLKHPVFVRADRR